MQSYLIIKIAAIGDVVMALPMLEAIRKKSPNAHITWVCGKIVKELLTNFSIDELIVVDEAKLLKGSKAEKIFEVLKVWKKIAFRDFDYVALGHADTRYKILTALTRTSHFKRFSHEVGRVCPIPGRHHSDEYVRLVCDKLGTSRVDAAQLQPLLPAKIKEQLSVSKRIVVLAPGGAKNTLADDACRRWPIEHYAELARRLVSEKFQVILIGGKTDAWIRPYFKDINITDLLGQTSLLELIALFWEIDIFVTHDSGPMHLAGLANCKIVALFGPTNPYEKIPNRENVEVLWDAEKYACCPCYDGKTYAECENTICMREISVQRVLARVEAMVCKDDGKCTDNC